MAQRRDVAESVTIFADEIRREAAADADVCYYIFISLFASFLCLPLLYAFRFFTPFLALHFLIIIIYHLFLHYMRQHPLSHWFMAPGGMGGG